MKVWDYGSGSHARLSNRNAGATSSRRRNRATTSSFSTVAVCSRNGTPERVLWRRILEGKAITRVKDLPSPEAATLYSSFVISLAGASNLPVSVNVLNGRVLVTLHARRKPVELQPEPQPVPAPDGQTSP